uniref:Ribosyldihydronicotinamide dehydrogenase [quinone] n=1 Tax=Anolis carolinensis TaxID=28377 RepID=A0A803T9F2_ANOCA
MQVKHQERMLLEHGHAAWKTHSSPMMLIIKAFNNIVYYCWPFTRQLYFCHIFSTGELYNPEQLNYGVEAFEAYKNGCLSEDLKEEHRKVTEAELVIFQFPLYWYSMPAILKGWMDRVLVQGFAFNIPKGSGSGLLKNKKALLSFTTGGNQAMYTKEGISGDISYVLWPMQFGILQFCGFDVLAPQICFAPEYAPLEERRQMLTSWEKRLKTIWEEKPIPCILA